MLSTLKGTGGFLSVYSVSSGVALFVPTVGNLETRVPDHVQGVDLLDGENVRRLRR